MFQNNRHEVVKKEEKLWRNLEKENLLDAYHEEIKKYIARATFVELSESEMKEYSWPFNYITHHGEMKDSVTTQLRVVTNSSKKNGQLMPKGPNSLNDMLAVMLRFRTYIVAFVFDLSKAYNTMRTSITEGTSGDLCGVGLNLVLGLILP